MTTDNVFYTATMAKVHADQGNLIKATQIYTHLLRNDPGRPDLAAALARVRQRMNRRDVRDLIPLIRQWTEMRLHSRNLRHLTGLQAIARGYALDKNRSLP
jgi:hypothetical protein